MATVTAKNLQGVVYNVPHIGVTLQPTGEDGAVVNVTSELKNRTAQQYVDLQSEQMAGKVVFSVSGELDFDPGALVIRSATNIHVDTLESRGKVETPQSPIYFDAAGQGIRSIMIDGADGAWEIEFWGSIDIEAADHDSRKWTYVGKRMKTDPGMTVIDEGVVARLKPFRYIKADFVRGVSPKVYFRSTFA